MAIRFEMAFQIVQKELPFGRAPESLVRFPIEAGGERGDPIKFSAKLRERFEANFDEVRAAHEHKEKLLSADPFDKVAFLAELKAERAERADDEIEANEIFSDGIAQLSAEDRRKLGAMRLPPRFGGGLPFLR